MFELEEKSRNEKTVISNCAKEFLQMKKQSRQKALSGSLDYDTFPDLKRIPIQCSRTANPFYPPEQVEGAPALTGHHIIPFSLLRNLYNLLEQAQKSNIEYAAGAENNFGRDNPVTDYIEWPQENIFYGPNTSLRAEPGKKDDFDYDARFIIDKDLFQFILDIYTNLEKYKRKNYLTRDEREDLYNILSAFYKRTAAVWTEQQEIANTVETQEPGEETAPELIKPTELKAPALYSADAWQELTTYEEIERVAKYRPSVKQYSRFRLPLGGEIRGEQNIPNYPKIKKSFFGGYTYEEGGKSIIIPGSKEEGAFLIVPLELKGDAAKVVDYLKSKNAPTQTFLPRQLVSYMYALHDMQKLRDRIKEKEVSIQSVLEQIGEGLRWNLIYGTAPELKLENKMFETQIRELGTECNDMIDDCIYIEHTYPDFVAGVLEIKAEAERLKGIFES